MSQKSKEESLTQLLENINMYDAGNETEMSRILDGIHQQELICKQMETEPDTKTSKQRDSPIDLQSLEMPALSPFNCSEYNILTDEDSNGNPSCEEPMHSEIENNAPEGSNPEYKKKNSTPELNTHSDDCQTYEEFKFKKFDPSSVINLSQEKEKPSNSQSSKRKSYSVIQESIMEDDSKIINPNDVLPKRKSIKLDPITENKKEMDKVHEQDHTGTTQIFEKMIINERAQKEVVKNTMVENKRKVKIREQSNGSVNFEVEQTNLKQQSKVETKSPYFNASVNTTKENETCQSTQLSTQNEQVLNNDELEEIISSQDKNLTLSSYVQSYDPSTYNDPELTTENIFTGSSADINLDSQHYFHDMSEMNLSKYAESMDDLNSVSNLLLSPEPSKSPTNQISFSSPEGSVSSTKPPAAQGTSNAIYNMFAPKPAASTTDNGFSFSFNTNSNPKPNKLFSMF